MILAYYGSELLHDPRDDTRVFAAGSLELEANTSGVLKFALALTHPMVGRMRAKDVENEVVVTENGRELFRGRILDLNEDDFASAAYVCEGDLSYLNDSVLRPYSTYTDNDMDATIGGEGYSYFDWLIGQHNEQTDLHKQFTVQKNEAGTYGNLTRRSTVYPNTANEIKGKLLENPGGYVITEYHGTTRYISFLTDGRGENPQVIRFGENLLDFAKESSARDLITAIIPKGKREVEEKEETFGVEEYLDGALGDYCKEGDMVYSVVGVERYGFISDKRDYEITTVDGLVSSAVSDLSSTTLEIESIDISAADLSVIDHSLKPFELLEYIGVVSEPHGISEYMLCTQIKIDLVKPDDREYHLGTIKPTLTGSQSRTTANTRELIESVAQQVPAISQEARQASETANSKTQTYLSANYPEPPYSAGDRFLNTTTGEEYIANTTREA